MIFSRFSDVTEDIAAARLAARRAVASGTATVLPSLVSATDFTSSRLKFNTDGGAASLIPMVMPTVPETIPPSDPRHPQHDDWLAMQQGSFVEKYGLWIGLGLAGTILGSAFYFTRK